MLKLPDRRDTVTAEKRVERRLAAIMAADVVGYSRLMGGDEIGTLRALQAHRRELIDPKIAAHRGRIVKTTGDGLLRIPKRGRGCRLRDLDPARDRVA